MRRPWGVAGLLVGLVASCVCLGIIVSQNLLTDRPPASLIKPKVPDKFPVTVQEFSDPQPAKVEIISSPELEIRSPQEGILTTWECSDGAAWESAKSSLSLNGEKLLNLYSSVPLWRDLEIGLEGNDVVALKEELRRVGYETSGDDMFRRGDLNSFRALLKAAGMNADVQSVKASSIVWLPSPKIMISHCELGLGSRVAVDDTFVSSQSEVSAKILAAVSSESGPRTLHVGELALPLAADLSLTTATDAMLITQTTIYRSAVEQRKEDIQGPLTIDATVRLVSPIQVASLPPASIHVESGSLGCIVSGDGDVHDVKIVGSELGSTIVVVNDDQIPKYVEVPGPARCP